MFVGVKFKILFETLVPKSPSKNSAEKGKNK